MMCDPECVKRFERVELKVNQIATDMKWFRWLVRTSVIGIGLFLGADLTGVV